MPPPPHGRLDRQYSTASWNTVTTLQQLELEFEAMSEASIRADATLANPPADGLPPGLRNELAQRGQRETPPLSEGQPRSAEQVQRQISAVASDWPFRARGFGNSAWGAFAKRVQN